MATLSSVLNTPFTPAVGAFAVQCTDGVVQLQRRQTSVAPWIILGLIHNGEGYLVDNPVAGQQYRFVTVNGTPVVQADQ